MHKVYVELVFLDNFALDFFILVMGSRLSCKRASLLRCAAGGAIGGAYGAAAVVAPLLYTLPAKLLFFVAMCAAALPSMRFRDFLISSGKIFAVALLCSGSVMAAAYMLGGSVGTATVGAAGLRYIVAGAAVAATAFELISRRHYPLSGQSYSVTVTVRGEKLVLRAFLDTGNCIRDISGRGVIVADRGAAAKAFSAELLADIVSGCDHIETRVFPCRTASGRVELPGFFCDDVVVCDSSKTWSTKCFVLLGSVSKDGFDALLSPYIELFLRKEIS